ncbi:hypothetical protein [Haladaptatus sp. NG-WS-4]
MRRVASHVVRAADGHHEEILVRVGDFPVQQNVYGAIEWSDGTESVFCRRVGDEWQALAVEDGMTRTLLAGLGSRNHTLWLAREYMEFGRTYETKDVWTELPLREQSNPFRDLHSNRHEIPRP